MPDAIDQLLHQMLAEARRHTGRQRSARRAAEEAIAAASAAIADAAASAIQAPADLDRLRARLAAARALIDEDPKAARAKARAIAAEARRLPLRIAAAAWQPTAAIFLWHRWRCECGAEGAVPAADHLLVRRQSRRRDGLAVELPEPEPPPGLPVIHREQSARRVTACPACAPTRTGPSPTQLHLWED